MHFFSATVVRWSVQCLQEYLSEALQEERERSEANVQRAVESARKQVQVKMEDLAKVSRSDHWGCTLSLAELCHSLSVTASISFILMACVIHIRELYVMLPPTLGLGFVMED